MKVVIVRGGGVAGLTARTELDSGALPKSAAKTLAGELARANLDDVPEPPGTVSWPDAQLYEISVEGRERSITVHFTDESMPENVRLLMAWVDSRPERIESIE